MRPASLHISSFPELRGRIHGQYLRENGRSRRFAPRVRRGKAHAGEIIGMNQKSYDFCKTVSGELDPRQLHRKFLAALLELQNVERGSIWVKHPDGYQCVEALGSQSEKVKGLIVGPDRPSIVGWVIENGKMTVGEPGKDIRHYKQAEQKLTVKSTLILCFPLFLKNGEVYGAVQIIDTATGGDRLNLNEGYLDLLQNLVDIGSIALGNSLVYTDQVMENRRLRQALEAMRSEEMALCKSDAFTKALKTAGDYAATDFPVLLTGESGTGKELMAREIYRMSARADKPFLVQNCSAIPETLLESELFGYEKGAFTGATKDKIGLFEAADGGTVFLDEIGDMPLQLQARILRVLQNNEIKPLGGTRTKRIDVRIISATNKDLQREIAAGQFREDLFYRLNVLPLHLPPLRERRGDIPLLLDHFLKREALKMGVPQKTVSREALENLTAGPWKGNIRELENCVRHVMVVSQGNTITTQDLELHFIAAGTCGESGISEPDPAVSALAEPPLRRGSESAARFRGCSWEELEREYVLHLLEKNRWHITRAAVEAGVNRSTFDSRMRRLGIRK